MLTDLWGPISLTHSVMMPFMTSFLTLRDICDMLSKLSAYILITRPCLALDVNSALPNLEGSNQHCLEEEIGREHRLMILKAVQWEQDWQGLMWV